MLSRAVIALVVICGLATGCSTPRLYSEIHPGQEFPARWLKKKTSIQQIESEIVATGRDVKEEWLAEWAKFRASYQSGIEVWAFEDEAQWDLHLVGYAMIRDGRLVASIGGIRKKEQKPNQLPEPMYGLAPGHGSS